ncbi:MAG: hypothetical protein JJU37_17130 [Balneolaceae bacterium]|nr:hypothetical protein [Balneolaceae bacterium]
MNIYIPIEVKARELEGRGLLAIVAAERGHRVILGNKSETRGLCKKALLPKGILHEKSLTPSESTIKYFKKLKTDGYLLTSQDEEHGLTTENYEDFAAGRYSEESISCADKIFSWGKHDNGSLKKLYPNYADRFMDSGSPRVDFWRKEFDGYFTDSYLVKNSITKPYIFIPSNFSFLLGEDRIWNIMARMRRAGYFERSTNGVHGEFRLYGDLSYRIKLIGEFVNMVRELSKTFPDVQIILRPHPIEVVDSWKKMIGEYPNVKVIREGSISSWIRNATVVINNGCTSALEAAANDVPRIAYRPCPSEFEYSIPNDVCHQAMSLNELKDLVRSYLSKMVPAEREEVDQKTDDVLGSRFSNLKGKLAADKIVDAWEVIGNSLSDEDLRIDDFLKIKKSEKVSFHNKALKKAVKIKRAIFQHEKPSDTDEQLLNNPNKFSSFTDEEMESLLMNLRNTLNRFQNVKYKRFGSKSFIIYSD